MSAYTKATVHCYGCDHDVTPIFDDHEFTCPRQECSSTDLAACDADSLGNQHGYRCPQCMNGDNLRITVTQEVQLTPMGTNDVPGDTLWEDENAAYCGHCDWGGWVRNLITDPNFEL